MSNRNMSHDCQFIAIARAHTRKRQPNIHLLFCYHELSFSLLQLHELQTMSVLLVLYNFMTGKFAKFMLYHGGESYGQHVNI